MKHQKRPPDRGGLPMGLVFPPDVNRFGTSEGNTSNQYDDSSTASTARSSPGCWGKEYVGMGARHARCTIVLLHALHRGSKYYTNTTFVVY